MHISIVIPTYNRAALLKETLDSVVGQTYGDWECIVVDDGSTDETETVVSSFGPSIQYLRQANAGPAVARNRGVERTKGDAVMFLDSDDLLTPYALEHLARKLRTHPEAGVAYGGYHMIHSDGRPGLLSEAPLLPNRTRAPVSSRGQPVAYGLTVTGQILPTLLLHDAMLMGATLIRRQVVERIGEFNPSRRYMEHWEYFLRIAKERIPFAATQTPVVQIRMHPGNLSRDFEGMLRCRLELLEKYVPRENTDMEQIRLAARANAQLSLGMCFVDTGQLDPGLKHLREGLHHRPLMRSSYDAFTNRVCKIALEDSAPLDRVESILRDLGPSAHAHSLKHFVMSRFHRIRAMGDSLDRNFEESDALRRCLERGGHWAHSGKHLALAVFLHPVLGKMYLRRLLERVQFSRSST